MKIKEMDDLVKAYRELSSAVPFNPKEDLWCAGLAKGLGDLSVTISRESYDILEPYLHARYETTFSIDGGIKLNVSGNFMRYAGVITTEDEATLGYDPVLLFRLKEVIEHICMTCKRVKLADIIGNAKGGKA